MHCEPTVIGVVPPVIEWRVYEDGMSGQNYDPYFTSCISITDPDGIPEVRLFSPPKMSRQKCRLVRLALGEAFAQLGFKKWKRTLPHSGKITVRNVLSTKP